MSGSRLTPKFGYKRGATSAAIRFGKSLVSCKGTLGSGTERQAADDGCEDKLVE
jgi:hypothetical protein